MLRRRSLLLIVIFLALARVAMAEEPTGSLPIKRVVMFNSGVSFFEHNGTVKDDAKIDLKFNVDDINDLLKSMVLQDLGDGQISTVSYSSKDPISRTLDTFSINLTGEPTLADLLRQVRGEKVELDAPAKIAGVIIGVETRKRRVGDNETIDEEYLNLLTDDGLRSVRLSEVGRIKLADASLDAELRKALAVLASAKSRDKKEVTLNFTGKGERPVRVGYIQESPVWKTSYRLVLDNEGKPLLQGWAIVENTTEADWNDVNLALVSGRPISFMMDLYEPLYVNRPEVQLELYSSLRPRVYNQDLAQADAEFRKKAANATGERLEQLARRSRDYAEKAKADYDDALAEAGDEGQGSQGGGAAPPAKWNLQQGVQSAAMSGNVGQMFQYAIKTPVSLARGRSAMLPIVDENIEAEQFSIYSQSVHAKHPLLGLRLKNTSDLHLMQGPITVFEGGNYGGDAQIMDLPPGSERLISYAMDLNTEVAPETKPQKDELVSAKLVKGTLFSNRKYTQTTGFTVKNSGEKAKTVLIEFPLDSYWTLIKPEMPAEKTRDMYRFAVKAEPGKPATLDVVQEHIERQSLALTNLDNNTIGLFVSAPQVSEAVKKALREVIERKVAIENVVNERREFERQVSVVDQEQNRIRQNMAQLERNSDLYRRYVTKFTEQENKVETLREQITASIEKETKLRQELDGFLIGLDLE